MILLCVCPLTSLLLTVFDGPHPFNHYVAACQQILLRRMRSTWSTGWNSCGCMGHLYTLCCLHCAASMCSWMIGATLSICSCISCTYSTTDLNGEGWSSQTSWAIKLCPLGLCLKRSLKGVNQVKACRVSQTVKGCGEKEGPVHSTAVLLLWMYVATVYVTVYVVLIFHMVILLLFLPESPIPHVLVKRNRKQGLSMAVLQSECSVGKFLSPCSPEQQKG